MSTEFLCTKFCIKGSWDTTGKLVKDTILKNEMKYYRCANVYRCYLKLNQDLVKNGQARLNKKWLEWEMSGEKISQNTHLKINRTFIGLNTEYTNNCTTLTSANNQKIIYTNHKSMPDMVRYECTQSFI